MAINAIPRNPEELAEYLDGNRRKEFLADGHAMAGFIADYTKEAMKHDPDLQRQAREMRAKVLKDIENDNSIKRLPLTDRRRSGRSAGRTVGDALNGQFESFGEFLKAADYGSQIKNGHIDSRFVKALGEGQGDQGGFLVPEEYRAEIMMLSLEDSVVRPRATVIPMDRETVAIPTIRSTSHASSVYGGVVAYWTPENTSVTQTEPTFSQARLNAHKLAGGTKVGMELMEDSVISIEALLLQMFGGAVGFFEDDAFINGTGAGQPTGILNAAALVSVSKETGQAAATIVWENVVKMFARMLPSSLGSAVWVANLDTVPQLATMSLAVGTGGAPVWLQNGQGALPTSILGRPVVYTEKAQTLGTAGDLYFTDFRQYLIGDRRSLQVTNSPHSSFLSDQMDWKFTHRVDGRPWIDSALTPRNGSNTLSPFVSLATRS